MKKFLVITLSIVTILLLLLGLKYLDTQDKLLSVSAQLLETRQTLSRQVEQLEKASQTITSLNNLLDSYRKDLQFTQEELTTNQAKLATTQANLALTKEELTTTRTNLTLTKEELAKSQVELIGSQEKLNLYEDTYGEIYSNIQPPYKVDHLINNEKAVNPSWAQLKNFLLEDDTDKAVYLEGAYMCGGFAVTLHNNAEKAGIRAAFVGVEFEEGPDHALNAFKTTDRGLIFIDVTGTPPGVSRPSSMDTIVNLRLGKSYLPQFIFESDWYFKEGSKVENIKLYW